MNERLAAIARRRAALAEEIAAERDELAHVLLQVRTQIAFAGVVMLATLLLRRSRWLRLLGAAGAVLVTALPLLARAFPKRS
jgi:hypothetical protein